MEKVLRPDQIEDLGVLLTNHRHIHGGQPGTGKTPTICVNQAARWRDGIGTVWVMPKGLMEKNYEEAMEWGHWKGGQVVVVDGSPAAISSQLASGAALFIMGFTRFALSYRDLPDHVKAIDVDEFHKGFGSNDSKRTQALYQFTRDPDVHFVPMTGTLYKGKPDTVYPAIQIIEPRYYGTYDAFKKVHHMVDPWTGKVIDYMNLHALGDVLSKHSIKREWKAIHGDGAPVFHVETAIMSPKQREIYEQFEKEALVELEQFFIDGTKPGVAFIRARQIMEHPNRFPDLRYVDRTRDQYIDLTGGELSGKLELAELDMTNARENRTPIVFYSALVPQQETLAVLAQSVGLRVALLNGNVSAAERGQADIAFRKGELDCLIASDQVADCGYNWQISGDQEVNDCVFVSLGYDDATIEQAYKRFIRHKREAALRVKVYRYRHSLDDRIMFLTKQKSIQAKKVDENRETLPW